eukprot:m.39270 g.39270  ORF g.39270 m.39270 type:complete len:100 (-) comp11760_c0_seq1:1124-1423(-)
MRRTARERQIFTAVANEINKTRQIHTATNRSDVKVEAESLDARLLSLRAAAFARNDNNLRHPLNLVVREHVCLCSAAEDALALLRAASENARRHHRRCC